jgi:hypothetical protein
MQPYVDCNGKIQTKRKLPEPIPVGMVPQRVLRVFAMLQEGMSFDSKPREYEARKECRRYHLMPSKQRRSYRGKSPASRRQTRREYLKQRQQMISHGNAITA